MTPRISFNTRRSPSGELERTPRVSCNAWRTLSGELESEPRLPYNARRTLSGELERTLRISFSNVKGHQDYLSMPVGLIYIFILAEGTPRKSKCIVNYDQGFEVHRGPFKIKINFYRRGQVRS